MSTVARRRRILDVCLGVALASSACKGEEPVVDPDGGGSTPGNAAAPTEVVAVEHPSQMLPRDTSILVLGSSVNRAAEVFERERLVEVFRAQYEAISAGVRLSTGHDLFDPGAWQEVGLDANGPLGVSFSDVGSARTVVFATIVDRPKLIAFVREVAGKSNTEIATEAYGPSLVLRARKQSDFAIVLRDDIMALTFGGRAQEGFDFPQLLATMDPNVSLAADVGYRKATGGLRAADLSVYVDIAQLVEQSNFEAGAQTNDEPPKNWAREQFERAQQEGAGPEQLAELERRALKEEQRQARWRKRDEGERALTELLVSGIDGVGLTSTAKRSGPVLDGRIVAGEEAFVRRLLRNTEGEPLLPHVMNGTPLWCMAGGIDGTAAFELLEAVAGAQGLGYGEFLADAKAKVGIDLDVDLQPVLGSEAGLCIVLDGKLDLQAVEPHKQIGVGAFFRVTDAAKAKYLLAKVATSRSPLALLMRKRGEGYTIEVPSWRTVHVDPVGDRIVISTDRELATRIASGDPGSMPSKIEPAAARGAVALPGTAVSQLFDVSLLTLWMTATRSQFGEVTVEMDGLSAEETAKVPHSAKSKKARKALDKARKELEVRQRERSARELETLLKITDPLGVGVVAATEDERGFTLTGGQFVRAPSLGHVFEGLLRAATGANMGMDANEMDALDKAWQRESEARQAYFEARSEDIARTKGKRDAKP